MPPIFQVVYCVRIHRVARPLHETITQDVRSIHLSTCAQKLSPRKLQRYAKCRMILKLSVWMPTRRIILAEFVMSIIKPSASFADSPAMCFVVTTHPNRELLAVENLIRQDFRAYCPLIWKRIRHARRQSDEKRPLFPSYIFVEYRESLAVRPILSTVGVRSVVRTGDKPALVSRSLVDEFKAREVNGVVTSRPNDFAVGQHVRIGHGTLSGIATTIIQMKARDRVTVLLQFLGEQRPVEVTANLLSPAAP